MRVVVRHGAQGVLRRERVGVIMITEAARARDTETLFEAYYTYSY